MNKETFEKILKEQKIIETNNCFLLYVLKIDLKTSMKGNPYKLVHTINKNQETKNYFFFELKQKIQPLENNYIYVKILPLGDNWKINEIYEIIKNQENFNCSKCLWQCQSVCKQCNNGFYFQTIPIEPKTSNTPNTDNNIQNSSHIKPDFKNEEEIFITESTDLVNINDYFPPNPEAEKFWKEYENKKETI